MSAVLGVDGCPGGWVGALVDGDRVSWLRLRPTSVPRWRWTRRRSASTWDRAAGDRPAGVRSARQDARGRRPYRGAAAGRGAPELSFTSLAGRVLASKHTAAGLAERRRALQQWLPGLEEVPWGDDGLDALVVAWSAARWLAGAARTLPADPPTDGRGRPMRIVT